MDPQSALRCAMDDEAEYMAEMKDNGMDPMITSWDDVGGWDCYP